MKYWYYLILIFFMVSCKSKAIVIDTKKPPNVEREDSVLTSKKIIQNHNSTKNSFSSLYIRSNVKYKDENNSQNVSAEIKIKKDEKILIIIRFLGITMAKALITPTEVKYYEKINGTYFEGNFQSLSQWLGTDLDFNKIQNMLLGQPIINVTIGNYSFTTVEELYKLNAIEDKINTSFYFEKEHFFLKKQEFSEPEKARSFEISYPSFQKAAFAVLPTSLLIKAVQAKGTTTIAVDYNSVTFNEDLPFSYSVPDGYDRIFINLNDQNK